MLPFHKFNAPLKNHPKQSTSSVFSAVRCDAIELIWALKGWALLPYSYCMPQTVGHVRLDTLE